jgi:hypothetical protein
MLKAKDMMKKLTLLKLEIVLIISYTEGAHLLEPLALVSLSNLLSSLIVI